MSLRFIHTGSVLRHETSVTAACWAAASLPSAPASPGGASTRALVTASDDGTVGVWNGDGEWQGVLFSTRGEYGIIDFAASPAAPELVAAACSDGALRLFSAAGGREEKRVAASAAGAAIISVRWSSDGGALATGGEDGCVKVWSRAGALRTTLATCAGPVYAVRWGPDANTVLWASGRDLFIASLTADAGGAGRAGKAGGAAGAGAAGAGGPAGALSWKAHDGVVLSADWCPTTGRIVSGGEDGRYKVWDSLGRPCVCARASEQRNAFGLSHRVRPRRR
jgi:intraflagellar transport protein 80